MTSKTQTIWTCDRCSREVRTESEQLPKKWSDLELDSTDRPRDEWSICDGCTSQVLRFMTNSDNVPPA
jgi:DNA-directed RNA polymerase subunit RPC12/RpoP